MVISLVGHKTGRGSLQGDQQGDGPLSPFSPIRAAHGQACPLPCPSTSRPGGANLDTQVPPSLLSQQVFLKSPLESFSSSKSPPPAHTPVQPRSRGEWGQPVCTRCLLPHPPALARYTGAQPPWASVSLSGANSCTRVGLWCREWSTFFAVLPMVPGAQEHTKSLLNNHYLSEPHALSRGEGHQRQVYR